MLPVLLCTMVLKWSCSEVFIGRLAGLQELLQLFVKAFVFFLCNTAVLGLFLHDLGSVACQIIHSFILK